MHWSRRQTSPAPYDGRILDEDEILQIEDTKSEAIRIHGLWNRSRLLDETRVTWYQECKRRGLSDQQAEFAAFGKRYAFRSPQVGRVHGVQI